LRHIFQALMLHANIKIFNPGALERIRSFVSLRSLQSRELLRWRFSPLFRILANMPPAYFSSADAPCQYKNF